ncbi:MAG: hypothetical protein M1837_000044 [Sclerophora amabilis]|nr:MAG: hypothetical protein M1837_000044 [Sclerophora amabilis]
MNYTPPRGPCTYKPSLLSASCPCLRFMVHPLRVATSFECDGCAHHASFHRMESREGEDAGTGAGSTGRGGETRAEDGGGQAGRRKRRRVAGGEGATAAGDGVGIGGGAEYTVLDPEEDLDDDDSYHDAGPGSGVARARSSRGGRGTRGGARGRQRAIDAPPASRGAGVLGRVVELGETSTGTGTGTTGTASDDTLGDDAEGQREVIVLEGGRGRGGSASVTAMTRRRMVRKGVGR